MIIFGRRIKPRAIPSKVFELSGMIIRSFRFKHALQCWLSYAKRRPPNANVCELRSGTKIFLSSNPHDIITVMVNFCRNEYGLILPGWTVVDVGANIGAFTVMAMESGASNVIAFEPNREAFETLSKNVQKNGFQQAVRIHQRAVSDSSGQTLYIPDRSSPYNKTKRKSESGAANAVSTISLSDALSDFDHIDLMKLDCEGAEYQIILDSKIEVFNKIDRIRMELHPSRQHTRAQVVQHLESNGLSLVHRVGLIFWFERQQRLIT